MHTESDESLIRSARHGDDDALHRLTLRYQDKIFTMVRTLIPSSQVAVSAAEDIFVRTFTCILETRQRELFHIQLYRTALEVLGRYSVAHSDRELTSDEDILRGKIRALPGRLRAVILLHDVVRLPGTDVADILEIGDAKMRTILSEARTALIAEHTEIESVCAA